MNIPFDHIKVLPNGNYGCTLLIDNYIYCAIFTPDWQVVKPLHAVEEDLYEDYTYIRDWSHFPVGSYYKHGVTHPVDKDLLTLLDIGLNVVSNDDLAIEIEDYILDSPKRDEYDEKDSTTLLLFTTNYLDKNGNIAIITYNTLASYQMVSRAVIRSMFNIYSLHGCDMH